MNFDDIFRSFGLIFRPETCSSLYYTEKKGEGVKNVKSSVFGFSERKFKIKLIANNKF